MFGVATMIDNSSVPADQEAALEGTDFTTTIVQVSIPDGSTSGSLSVPIIDNQVSGPLKVFNFTLTSVAGGKYWSIYPGYGYCCIEIEVSSIIQFQKI